MSFVQSRERGLNSMANYNERLTDELVKLQGRAIKDWESDLATAKQAITLLIKELVAEAKPNRENKQYTNPIYNSAIYDFEQNLLKELEEI